jgi:hypothetical protein
MPLTVTLLFVLAAFIATIMAATNRCPLWIAVLLAVVVEMLMVLPR